MYKHTKTQCTMKPNTNWSQPKTNVFAAVKDLAKALESGYNATLIKQWNEDCQYPIRKKNSNKDFRSYELNYGGMSSHELILNSDFSEFQKELSLNYKSCYGSKEAVDKYYETGELTMDNVRGVGVSHLVKVTDLIELLQKNNHDGSQTERIENLMDTYINHKKGWFDFFKLKRNASLYTVKKFKRKLWVGELLPNNVEAPKLPLFIKILLNIYKPLNYLSTLIPQRSVLKMDGYTNYTFRIGSIYNGFSVEFQIPKKFRLKN